MIYQPVVTFGLAIILVSFVKPEKITGNSLLTTRHMTGRSNNIFTKLIPDLDSKTITKTVTFYVQHLNGYYQPDQLLCINYYVSVIDQLGQTFLYVMKIY